MSNIDHRSGLGVGAVVTAGELQWRLSSAPCFAESQGDHSRGLTVIIVLLMLTIGLFPGSVHTAEGESKADQVFATVNGESIQLSTYRSILHMGARQRFYHGQPPAEELKAYRKEVGEQLVEEMVLHQEALRRGIEANSERVKHEVEKNIKRLQTQTGWQDAKNKMLPILQEGLARNDRIRQLQDQFRSEVTLPDETELETFYQANLDKFTSPPQTRISMILLKVPPWGGADQWRTKRDELTQIKHKITKGMEFSEAAKRYSNDGSASSGGDMGYLHQGMLGTQAEQAISKLGIGEISDPITLLEGVALFHLIERSDARINPLEQVRQRAVDLLMRERRETVVSEQKRRLRIKADIHYLVPDYYEQRQEVRGRSNKNKS